MYLIDTSIWIDFFKQNRNVGVNYFQSILDQRYPYGITSIIYQEILQGVSSEKEFELLNDYLKKQTFYHPRDAVASYAKAAQLYRHCRTKGITIRSSIDCLIAQIAIDHHLILVHNDTDFVQLQKAAPELKLYKI